VEFPCEVEGLDLRWGRLQGVQTNKGKFEAEILVIACGVDTPRVASMAGLEVPLIHSPGLLAHTRPLPRLLETIIVAPGAHFRQTRGGKIVIGEEAGPPSDETHEHLSSGPQAFPDEATSEIHVEPVLTQAGRFLPALETAEIERVDMGWRPLPKDGYPIVGFTDGCPDIYLAVMHSGVTLGALMGRLAMLEILDGVGVDMLSPYRLSRFRSGGGASPPH
jgi:glycine/D-amino acid oxidase-like deaminating enzyme